LRSGNCPGPEPSPNGFDRNVECLADVTLAVSFGMQGNNLLVAFQPALSALLLPAFFSSDSVLLVLRLIAWGQICGQIGLSWRQLQVTPSFLESSFNDGRQIQHQVEPVRNLYRVWRASRSAIGIGSTAISINGFDRRMSVKPQGHILCRPIGQTVKDFVPF